MVLLFPEGRHLPSYEKVKYTLHYQCNSNSFPRVARLYFSKMFLKMVKVFKFPEGVSIENHLSNYNKVWKKHGSTAPIATLVYVCTDNRIAVYDHFERHFDDLTEDEVIDSVSKNTFAKPMKLKVIKIIEAFEFMLNEKISLSNEFSATNIVLDVNGAPKIKDLWYIDETPDGYSLRLRQVLTSVLSKFIAEDKWSYSIKTFLRALESDTVTAPSFRPLKLKYFPCLLEAGSFSDFVVKARTYFYENKKMDVARSDVNFCLKGRNWLSNMMGRKDHITKFYGTLTDKELKSDTPFALFHFARHLFVHYNEWALKENAQVNLMSGNLMPFLDNSTMETIVENLLPDFSSNVIFALIDHDVLKIS